MTVLSGLPSVLELDNVFSDLGSLDSVPGGTIERSSGENNDLKIFFQRNLCYFLIYMLFKNQYLHTMFCALALRFMLCI